jgi:hypothetical protein
MIARSPSSRFHGPTVPLEQGSAPDRVLPFDLIRATGQPLETSDGARGGGAAYPACSPLRRCGATPGPARPVVWYTPGMMSRDAFVAHQRVYRALVAAKPTLGDSITVAQLQRALGPPLLDASRIGPPLRDLGFRPVRQRRGSRRAITWLLPGVPVNRGGHPRRRQELVGSLNQAHR